MAPVATPAIILATLRYGETSKIVRLATRDLGVQSAIAKGASRPKSKFGAALQAHHAGTAPVLLQVSITSVRAPDLASSVTCRFSSSTTPTRTR